MEWLFNWQTVMLLFVVSGALVIGGLLVEDNISKMPKGFQAWWKRHICDTEENLWPSKRWDD